MQAKNSCRDSLLVQAKERYERKLKLVGLHECPYSLVPEIWEDDVTKWPGVEFPNIVLTTLPRLFSARLCSSVLAKSLLVVRMKYNCCM